MILKHFPCLNTTLELRTKKKKTFDKFDYFKQPKSGKLRLWIFWPVKNPILLGTHFKYIKIKVFVV